MTYFTYLFGDLQHNSGICELGTSIPLSIADLNVVLPLFINKKDITNFHLILREVTTKLKQ